MYYKVIHLIKTNTMLTESQQKMIDLKNDTLYRLSKVDKEDFMFFIQTLKESYALMLFDNESKRPLKRPDYEMAHTSLHRIEKYLQSKDSVDLYCLKNDLQYLQKGHYNFPLISNVLFEAVSRNVNT